MLLRGVYRVEVVHVAPVCLHVAALDHEVVDAARIGHGERLVDLGAEGEASVSSLRVDLLAYEPYHGLVVEARAHQFLRAIVRDRGEEALEVPEQDIALAPVLGVMLR